MSFISHFCIVSCPCVAVKQQLTNGWALDRVQQLVLQSLAHLLWFSNRSGLRGELYIGNPTYCFRAHRPQHSNYELVRVGRLLRHVHFCRCLALFRAHESNLKAEKNQNILKLDPIDTLSFVCHWTAQESSTNHPAAHSASIPWSAGSVWSDRSAASVWLVRCLVQCLGTRNAPTRPYRFAHSDILICRARRGQLLSAWWIWYYSTYYCSLTWSLCQSWHTDMQVNVTIVSNIAYWF